MGGFYKKDFGNNRFLSISAGADFNMEGLINNANNLSFMEMMGLGAFARLGFSF